MTVETQKLLITNYNIEDEEVTKALFLWGEDKESENYLHWNKQNNFNLFVASRIMDLQYGKAFIARQKENINNIVAYCRISNPNTVLINKQWILTPTILWITNPLLRRQGLTTEFLSAVLEYLNLPICCVVIDNKNIASQKLAEKLGFIYQEETLQFKKYLKIKEAQNIK